MKKISIPFLWLFLLSCTNNRNNIQFKAMEQSLSNSNSLITSCNNSIYQELADKLHDPQTRAKAEIWEPKAAEVKRLSAVIKNFINNLETDLKKDSTNNNAVKKLLKEQGSDDELLHKLIGYKNELMATIKPEEFPDNPLMQKNMELKIAEFKKTLLPDIEERSEKKTSLPASYFENISVIGSLAILNKIQNDILLAENAIVAYFENMTNSNIHSYEKFSAILTQNSSYLKSGQRHEIYAGVGAFSLAANPKITINGILIKPNENGVSIYTSAAGQKPGNYAIPVKFEFIKPDGSPFSMTEHIEYIVR